MLHWVHWTRLDWSGLGLGRCRLGTLAKRGYQRVRVEISNNDIFIVGNQGVTTTEDAVRDIIMIGCISAVVHTSQQNVVSIPVCKPYNLDCLTLPSVV